MCALCTLTRSHIGSDGDGGMGTHERDIMHIQHSDSHSIAGCSKRCSGERERSLDYTHFHDRTVALLDRFFFFNFSDRFDATAKKRADEKIFRCICQFASHL